LSAYSTAIMLQWQSKPAAWQWQKRQGPAKPVMQQ